MVRMGILRLAAIIIALTCAGGCVRTMAQRIIETPNKGIAQVDKVARGLQGAGAREAFAVDVRDARIQAWVLDAAGPGKPKGTVVLMHGLLRDSRQTLPFARALAAAGFRCLLVDLRGHGASTGKYQTYGVEEARDVAAVLDRAYAEKLIVGPLGAWGFSLGGATALQAAARDGRLKAAVSVEAFASMRDEVPRFGRILVPIFGWVSDETYTKAINRAGQMAGFNPDDADTVAAVKRIGYPVLIIHSAGDGLVPLEAARSLRAAGRAGSELVVVSAGGHDQVEFDRTGEVAAKTVEWFVQKLNVATAAAAYGENQNRK